MEMFGLNDEKSYMFMYPYMYTFLYIVHALALLIKVVSISIIYIYYPEFIIDIVYAFAIMRVGYVEGNAIRLRESELLGLTVNILSHSNLK